MNTVGAIRLKPGQCVTFSCRTCGHRPRPWDDRCRGVHSHQVRAVVPVGGAAEITLASCQHCSATTYTARPAGQIMYVD